MSRQRPGITLLIAIICIALVGTALTLVAQLASDDVRRTIAEREEAQQRQLLLAGVRDVAARLTAGESPLKIGPIPTPAAADATLAIDAVEETSADRVVIAISAASLRQRAAFVRAENGAWRLATAVIVR